MTIATVILGAQLGLGFAIGWFIASLFKLSKGMTRLMTDLSRLNASATALLAAASSLITLQNNTIAELRQIAGNTGDPDVQIQVNALADKLDAGTQAAIAALKASDPDGDGEPNLDTATPPEPTDPDPADGDAGDDTPPAGDTDAGDTTTTTPPVGDDLATADASTSGRRSR